jgi:hypothetical protein
MRRRSTTVAGIAAAALALVAAGCGGGDGGGERLTLEEFVSQADAICAEYDGRFDDLGEPQSASELTEVLRKGQDVAAEQVAKLRELTPPEDVQEKVDTAYATLDEQVALFDDMADAAEANDEAKMQEISEQLDQLNGKADEIAKEIGLTTCGSDG